MARVPVHHLRQELPDNPPVRLGVDSHDFVSEVFVHIHQKLTLHETSVVDEDIDWSEALRGLLANIGNLLSIGDVELEHLHIFTLGLSFNHVLRSLASLFVDVYDGQFGTELGQSNRNQSSKA